MRKFKLGTWKVEQNKSLLTSDSGKEVRIEPLNMALLCYFIENPSEPIGRDKLIEDVWHNKIVTDHAVYKTINQLRKYLASDGDTQDYIKTIPKKGYAIVAPIEEIIEAAPKEAINIKLESTSANWFAKWFYKHPVLHTLGVLLFVGLLSWNFGLSAWWYKVKQPVYSQVKRIKSIQGYLDTFNISRDGKWGVFTVYETPDISDQRAVQVINLETFEVNTLLDNEYDYSLAKWSVSGDNLVLARRTKDGQEPFVCDLQLIGLSEDKSQIVSQENIASCSKTLTFAEYDDIHGEVFFTYTEDSIEPSKIYAYDVKAKQVQVLTSPVEAPFGDWSIELSPDLKKLAFLRVYDVDNELMIYNRDSEEFTKLLRYTSYSTDISWNHDGTEISYQPDKYHVNIYSLEHGVIRDLLVKENTIKASELSRIENGIYTISRNEGMIIFKIDDVLTSDGKQKSTIINNGAVNRFPVFANHSNNFIFNSTASGDNQTWLKVEDKKPIKISNFDGKNIFYAASFSPDDQQLLGELGGVLTILSPETNEHRVILKSEGDYYGYPFWWPDGLSIGFSYLKDGVYNIFRMDLESKEIKQVTTKGGYAGKVTNDGAFLYFVKYSEPGLWKLNLKSLNEVKVSEYANADSADVLLMKNENLYFTHFKNNLIDFYRLDLSNDEVQVAQKQLTRSRHLSITQDEQFVIGFERLLDSSQLVYYTPKPID